MSDYFVFGSVDTRNYNAQVYRKNIVTVNPIEYSANEIPGNNGDAFVSKNRFPNCVERYQIVIQSASPETDMDNFKNALLAQSGYQELTDSFDTSIFMQAVLSSPFDVVTVKERDVFKMNIDFNRKPQRFLVSGKSNIGLSSGDVITNPTMFPAKPRIYFRGTGNFSITNNAKSMGFEYDGPSDTSLICVDCESMECYQWSYQQNRNQYFTLTYDQLDFPVLLPGNNTIQFDDSITGVLINTRWWKL